MSSFVMLDPPEINENNLLLVNLFFIISYIQSLVKSLPYASLQVSMVIPSCHVYMLSSIFTTKLPSLIYPGGSLMNWLYSTRWSQNIFSIYYFVYFFLRRFPHRDKWNNGYFECYYPSYTYYFIFVKSDWLFMSSSILYKFCCMFYYFL